MEKKIDKMRKIAEYRNAIVRSKSSLRNSEEFKLFASDEELEKRLKHYSKRISLLDYAIDKIKEELK